MRATLYGIKMKSAGFHPGVVCVKRKKLKIRISQKDRKKERKTWDINPRTRVHDDAEYKRSKEKRALRKLEYDDEDND